MYTIAMIMQKGGAGKTTIAKALATAAAHDGLVSLLIDTDPQSSACNWNDRRKAGNVSDKPLVIDAQPQRLAAALQTAEQSGVEFVIIDTPARLSESALAAAKVADLIVTVCRPQDVDIDTLPSTSEIVGLGGNKPVLVVLNAIPSTGANCIRPDHEQFLITA